VLPRTRRHVFEQINKDQLQKYFVKRLERLGLAVAVTAQPEWKFSKEVIVSFVMEFWAFLRVRKRLWLLPVIVVLVGFGALLLLAQGSAVAPFIYSLF